MANGKEPQPICLYGSSFFWGGRYIFSCEPAARKTVPENSLKTENFYPSVNLNDLPMSVFLQFEMASQLMKHLLMLGVCNTAKFILI